MTDVSGQAGRSPKRKTLALMGGLALVIALFAVLLGGGGSVSKPVIEAQLKAFGERIAQEGRENGAEASFTYEGVDTSGFFFNRKATIASPRLSLTQKPAFGAASTTAISTPQAVAVAGGLTGRDLKVRFPQPFTVWEDGKEQAAIAFAGEPVFSLNRVNQGKNAETRHSLALPPKFTVTPAVGDNGAKPAPITVTYDANPVLAVILRDEGSREANTEIRNLRIVQEGEKPEEASVGSISVVSKQMADENGARRFDVVLAVNDIGMKTQNGENGPYSVKLSAQGSTPAAALDAAKAESDIVLRELMLSTDLYSLEANGTISQKADDPLPSGNVEVVIKNFNVFAAGPLVENEYRPLLLTTLSAIVGQSVEGLRDVSFTISREPRGVMMIGNVTFEQLIGHLLPAFMPRMSDQAPQGAAPVPAAPATQDVAPLSGETPLVDEAGMPKRMPELAPVPNPTPAPVPAPDASGAQP